MCPTLDFIEQHFINSLTAYIPQPPNPLLTQPSCLHVLLPCDPSTTILCTCLFWDLNLPLFLPATTTCATTLLCDVCYPFPFPHNLLYLLIPLGTVHGDRLSARPPVSQTGTGSGHLFCLCLPAHCGCSQAYYLPPPLPPPAPTLPRHFHTNSHLCRGMADRHERQGQGSAFPRLCASPTPACPTFYHVPVFVSPPSPFSYSSSHIACPSLPSQPPPFLPSPPCTQHPLSMV